jgi:hypothetical protein
MRRFLALAGLLTIGTLFVPTPVHAGGGCHGGGTPSSSGTTVELAMNCMTPRVLHSSTGRITFFNRDGVTHNLVGDNWGIDELRAKQSFVHEFASGTHAYSCTLHPGMVGAIVVGDGVVPTPIADVTPVRTAAASSTSDESESDRLPLGIALGAVLGVAATLGARKLAARQSTTA